MPTERQANSHVGAEAAAKLGWWHAHRFLVLRRISQLSILALFAASFLYGLDILKGNLSSSTVLNTVPLSDPFVLAQLIASGHWPAETALLGGAIVLLFYMLVGGRSYCSWVCPVNIVTDAASWLRRRLGISKTTRISNSLRYWLLGLSLLLPVAGGLLVWELVNPVSLLQRGLIFGLGSGWVLIAMIFLLDLLISQRAWCSHLCPMGAFYGLIGKLSVIRINARHRERCDDCMDCYKVCPEPQILKPVLKGAANGVSPIIFASDCTNCSRCIDVCAESVFEINTRFTTEVENKK